jgi:hypothetical protein
MIAIQQIRDRLPLGYRLRIHKLLELLLSILHQKHNIIPIGYQLLSFLYFIFTLKFLKLIPKYINYFHGSWFPFGAILGIVFYCSKGRASTALPEFFIEFFEAITDWVSILSGFDGG